MPAGYRRPRRPEPVRGRRGSSRGRAGTLPSGYLMSGILAPSIPTRIASASTPIHPSSRDA